MHTRYTFLKAALVAGFITPPILDEESTLVHFGAQAQTQPPPRVEWISTYTHEDERSESGVYQDFVYNPCAFETPPPDPVCQGRWIVSPMPAAQQRLGEPQAKEDSGEEWFFGHSNFKENGVVTGVITAGYATWPNCFWKGIGCTKSFDEDYDDAVLDLVNGSKSWSPRPKELERPNYRKGETRSMVARSDLDGNPIWYRKLLPGLLYNVIQDSEGNILVAGQTYANQWPNDMDPLDNSIIRWNADPTIDLNTIACSEFEEGNMPRLGYVAKLSSEGTVLWCTVLTSETGPQGFRRGSLMHELSSRTPELYGVVKRYAAAQQQGGWDCSAADLTYIENLAGQRETIGSALAYGWREALGVELPEEIILFPEETPKMDMAEAQSTPEWPSSIQLEVFPNPSSGPVFLAYQVSEGTDQGDLRVVDLSGRELLKQVLCVGPGALMLQTDAWAPGVYLAELRIADVMVASAKITVQ